MNPDFLRVKALFLAASEKQTPEDRSAFLNEACAGDESLRAKVEVLLSAHADADSFLKPLIVPMATVDEGSHVPERPGTVIGAYKLLQEIGEGGMGTVFLAEQTEPVRRKVALKIIKPGLDSAQVIARFEAERQALALMDHPNIAKVLDAGTTAGGRPFFVMELVKGSSVTAYCDENRLTPRQRLELFIPICHAIQHAHQKGVIHRDIKPSNVLVALYDGKPVPKVIDFGIAKATDQPLTEKTLFTRHGQIVGTFEYMSPEQATLDALDVDTRSDIYSLGVLLYELLTGTTPLDKERLRQAALLEVLRLIREVDPPKPSARLSESRGALVAASIQRQTDADKLLGLVSGELDWIVMKSLDKDRTRRYETANGLAMDVQRYLRDEQVQACPPSASCRMRKFVRRNKVALATSGLVAAALLLGTAVSVWQAVEANESRQLAEFRLHNETTARAMADENARKADENSRKADENARKANEQRQLVESHMSLALRTLGLVYRRDYLGSPHTELDKAQRAAIESEIAIYKEFVSMPRAANSETLRLELARADLRVGGLYVRLKNWNDAAASYRQALATLDELSKKFPAAPEYRRESVVGYHWLAQVLIKQDRKAEAIQYVRKSLAAAESLYDEEPTNAQSVERLLVALQTCAEVVEDREEAMRFVERRFVVLENAPQSKKGWSKRTRVMEEHDKVAWQLATDADEKRRDPKRALAHARKAGGGVKSRITLCAALYRNGLWEEAVAESEPLSQSWSRDMEHYYTLGYFISAMARCKAGNRAKGGAWYDHGMRQCNYPMSRNPEVQRFREEAAEVLGIEDGGKVQPAGEKPYGGIDPAVVTAWKKAGARFGYVWGVDGHGFTEFRPACRAVPGFDFGSSSAREKVELPPPNVPFGLTISSAGLMDADIAKFTKLKQMHHLRLQFNSRLSYEILKEIVALDQLRQLDLRDVVKNPDTDLKPLAALKHLETLRVYGSRVTDAHLQGLSELKRLHELDLSYSQVTSEGLKELAALQQLHTLHLQDTPITDAGLKHLSGLRQLKMLNVTGTQVTDTGFAEMQEAIPGLKRIKRDFGLPPR